MKGWLILVILMTGLCSYSFAQDNSDIDTTTKSRKKSGKVIEMDKSMFVEKVLDYEVEQTDRKFKGDKPVIIDFYTNWCIPCRATFPVMKSLAKEYDGKIVIYKVNGDKEKELVSLFDIPAYPSFVFINKDGQMKAFTGATNKKGFREMIDTFLLQEE